jgi:hypothetical protein
MFSSNTSQVSASAANFIEECFSTTLYTGNGSTQTITNGIDLAGKGGLVWVKQRDAANGHILVDTVRGGGNYLQSNTTGANEVNATVIPTFTATGFNTGGAIDSPAKTYASWTFREQPKFFDVVTWTGTDLVRTVSHNLGSVPGCIIVKAYSGTNAGIENWTVYHRSLGATKALRLNTTGAELVSDSFWNDTEPTSTAFTVADNGAVNGSGKTYVAYLFAHNAGGFGLTGTDNVISCGSFTTDGSGNATVSLGYEPQWIMYKRTDSTGFWVMIDSMRGIPTGGNDASLFANTSGAEATSANRADLTATGFYNDSGTLGAGATYIYIAIRRGPMKVPTTGTSVFTPVTQASFNAYSVGFPTDLVMGAIRGGNALNTAFGDRLRGGTQYLVSSSTAAEANDPGGLFYFDLQNSMDQGLSSSSSVFWNFRRAPGFFDEVIVTTNGQASAITSTHNLGVVPEMMIAKKRGPSGGTGDWMVYHSGLNGGVTPQNHRIRLNSTGASGASSGVWNNTAPTATQFTIGTDSDVNSGTVGDTTAFWLFASCPGVSKVGSYTGTGTAGNTVTTGFIPRFIMIKCTTTTGSWLVLDSARGLTSGNDPSLYLNTTAAEITNTDWVTVSSTGFQLNTTGNTSNGAGETYIYLAIA